ncbi:HAD-IA family hydrolase [Leptolyngbya sp. AN02str]|uniref:HAD-IA family hydrolase n=1 Tax=Leptolyngbya sp. AN02str TaxID=3423363 RepID=UPI003D31990F
MSDRKPRVIFFDAVGTLFGVRGSVGQIYGDLARQFGVEVDATALDHAFFTSFKAASPLAFPGVNADEVPEREYAWWWAIAAETFQHVGVLNQFGDFATFFSALYDHFASVEPWYVYPDTEKTLNHWREQGVELGIVSNFDSRIYALLPLLGLDHYFDTITISSEVGAAKPDTRVFESALQKHDCTAEVAWHVGDSFREDYEGAKAAGIRAIWLKRPEPIG